MTRVFYASTLFGAMSLAAAIDAGLFGPREERRLLIASTNTATPEISDSFVDSPAFAPLQHRFDDIVDWNALIAPLHPAGWSPRGAEVPLLARLFADHLGLHDGVRELVVESIAVPPSRTLGMVVPDCPITVYSDGLMSYGPTREELPIEIGQRAGRLLYLDLMPSVTPLLLRENEVETQAIPDSAFLKVVAELPQPPVDDTARWPLIIGQYLSHLGLLTLEEENRLHAGMLRALRQMGYSDAVFKPHPAAGRAHTHAIEQEAARLGLRLVVAADGLPAEAWFAAARPPLVVSCFSTALITADRYFGIPAAAMGTATILDRIVPYENSNRIPATIVDAVVPELRADGTLLTARSRDARDVSSLLRAVGYCMQARRHPDLRADAERYLRAHGRPRYFKNRRLERLGLVQPRLHGSVAAYRILRHARGTAIRLRAAWRRQRDGVAVRRATRIPGRR
jgi:hypothetical protein